MSLFNLRNYSKDDIIELLDLALEFKNGKEIDFQQRKVVANLFFEPSTRTHYSFDMAAKRLGCQTISFNPAGSSLAKNETFYDTVKFFEAIKPDALVIRHKEDNYYKQFKNIEIPIINGGDGVCNHPTQSLLDLLTIYENFKTISDLKILIVGDIKHSRVAHTNIEVLERLGNEVYLTSAKPFQEKDLFFVDFDEYIDKVDVVMLLRVQFERHQEADGLSYDTYLDEYGLSESRYDKLKDNAIILHPAPFNRGVEIAGSLVEREKSKIFEQMSNGLFLRMAVLYNELK
ncbi:aspartate carbamoyltransferase catalytic subunit [Bacilli bacterium PM5-3]|nr:aspartate carbamoyltransferase catalytic subunit [Bacilli bacterium PM5-3]MDH6604223.1 aspartate carbamoyltransferase catalytic subunit [Bacilli bacterium PM5-9]